MNDFFSYPRIDLYIKVSVILGSFYNFFNEIKDLRYLDKNMLHIYNVYMDQTLQARVKAIAQDVRWWAEGKCSDPELNGYCAIASAELFKALTAADIRAELCVWTVSSGASHCFVMVNDYVVDVTATQFRAFRKQPILILHIKEAECHRFYNIVHQFNTVDELRTYQKKSRWVRHQVAFA